MKGDTMLITHEGWRDMSAAEKERWLDVFALHGFDLSDIREIRVMGDRAVLTVYHRVDGEKHVWQEACPEENNHGRDYACRFEFECASPLAWVG